MKKRIILVVFGLLTLIGSAFSQTSWTAKYQLAFDDNDNSIIYLQLVPDNDGENYLSSSTVAYIVFPIGVDYTATSEFGSWDVKTVADVTDAYCGRLIQCYLPSPTSDLTVTTGVPVNLVKFQLATSGVAGHEYRMVDNSGNTAISGEPEEPCAVFVAGGVNNGLGVYGNSAAYTGNITSSDNPLVYPDTFDEKTSTSDDLNIGDIDIDIFPNPSNGLFTVELISDNDSKADLYVKNILGQQLFHKKCHTNTSVKIDIKEQSNGVYFLVYKNGTQEITNKLIIKK